MRKDQSTRTTSVSPASEHPTVESAAIPTRGYQLFFGAIMCAALIAVAYVLIITIRDRRWAASAVQQAESFAYASPVLNRDLGAVTSVKDTSGELAKRTPPTYDVGLRVNGQKTGGKVAIEVTRHGPSEWVVSAAKLEQGHHSVNLL